MGNGISGEELATPFYQPIHASSAAIAMASVALTNVINVTEEGKLCAIGVLQSGSPSGTPTITLEIQVDGQTTQSIALFTAALSYAAAARVWTSDVIGASTPIIIPIGLPYQSSCRVGINVTVAAGGSGLLDVSVMRGKRL